MTDSIKLRKDEMCYALISFQNPDEVFISRAPNFKSDADASVKVPQEVFCEMLDMLLGRFGHGVKE